MDRLAKLRGIAEDAGCAGLGVATADEFPGVAATIETRHDRGLSGKLRFTYKDPALATDVTRSFEWARRLVTVSWPYMPEAGNPGAAMPGLGRVARFAASDHYQGLRRALDAIADTLRQEGWRAEVLADDDRLVDRAAAVRAGIGWWGKSTMVLDPRFGPWLLLGSVVTDADLDATSPMARNCGTCDACIPACPTGAIIAPGVLDATRCIAHWTQMTGSIPLEIRQAMGDRIYGCDDCLDACPPGAKRVAEGATGPGKVDLAVMLASDDAALREAYQHFYLPKRNPRFLRRNALVALGNTTSTTTATFDDRERAVGILGGYLGDPDELYRAHAAWALGRVGGAQAIAVLRHQLDRERSEEVAAEIRAALSAAEGATN